MAYRTPYWETRRIGEEKQAGRLAETAAREAGLTERARIAATPKEPVATRRPAAAPRAEVPLFPERLEEGPLGEIMRASPRGVQAAYERMPIEERPIELIRGTERTYWSPGTRQEYGDLRTAMTGFQQRPEAERADVTTATGMTPYQTATLGLKSEELGFKQSQAELDYITKGLETRFASMADIGQQPTQDQITMQTGVLRNEWIKTNYSPKEARALIAKNPVELRQNKKTGEMRWYNEYGKPIKPEPTAEAAEVDIMPPSEVPITTPTPAPEPQPLSAEELYAKGRAGDSRYAIGRGVSAAVDTGKKVYENWLLRKNPLLDYAFGRSAMGR